MVRRTRRPPVPVLVRVIGYGALLAAGVLALDWIDYRRLARTRPLDLALVLAVTGFLLFGMVLGARLFATAAPPPDEGNPQAIAALGISTRELAVLREIAAGHSNKEIARLLGISPNTVKTHVARLLEKLDARRRTDALARARTLGLLP